MMKEQIDKELKCL
jgi:hypothetical protein